MPGRKPKPTALKIQDGNPGRRPLNTDEPKPIEGLPDCPDHLDDEARAEWDRLGPQLVREHRMAIVYRAGLAAYCAAWSRWVTAEREIQKFGMVIQAPSGYLIQSPYVGISNRAWDQLMRALSELGISPTSQAKVSKVEATTPVSKLSAYLVAGGKKTKTRKG